jgi:hypothetical protein
MSVLENGELRRKFAPKRQEAREGFRSKGNEKI